MPPRESPISPRIALRVAYLGAAAFIILGIIFFRLWYLQVLASDQNLAQARSNRLRDEVNPAPRGNILDRSGRELVGNRRATVVVLNPSSLPRDYREQISEWGRTEGLRLAKPRAQQGEETPFPRPPGRIQAIYDKLAGTLAIKEATVERRVVESMVKVPFGDVRIQADVDDAVRDHIREFQDKFPGVSVEERYLRAYPEGPLAAQVIGSVGEISEPELKDDRFRNLDRGAIVGHDGIEYSYDRFLRGTDGMTKIEVTALGDRRGVRKVSDPKSGFSLKTSLDLPLQTAGERALKQAGGGKPGAFVAMNPENGEIYAMGSYPSYDPTILTKPISQKRLRRIFSKRAGSPAFNRAIGGLYPTASTFKPVTALAALETRAIDTSTIVNDGGCIQLGEGEANRRCNAGSAPHGDVNVAQALQVSSNVFFYDMAIRLDQIRGNPLQRWARALGYGRPTGVDLIGEGKGVVPDPAWRQRQNRAEAECRARKRRPCGLADGENRSWKTGDEANLATGQGDLLASPLQVAVAYSTIANGGTVVRPHLGLDVLNDQGELEQSIATGRTRRVTMDPIARNAVMGGLLAATSEPFGTTFDVFSDWPHEQIPIYGKTGTAVRKTRPDDQSWFACYAYIGENKDKPIVIVTTVEDAGSGAGTAAPATKLMLAKWFDVPGMDELTRGASNDR